MHGLLVTLLYGSILVGVPAALIAAWRGRPVVLTSILLVMFLVSLLSSYVNELTVSHGPGKTGMALLIVGPWAIGITAGTALAAWILYVVGDNRQARDQSEDEPQ